MNLPHRPAASRVVTASTCRRFRPVLALAVAALSSWAPTCNAGIDDGLMAHWTLDGHALDSSPNGNHGTVHGGVAPTRDRNGREGMALAFDGVDGYISIPDSPTLHSPSQRTVSLWFRFDGGHVGGDGNVALFYQGAQARQGCETQRELSVWLYPKPYYVQSISAGDGGCQFLEGTQVAKDGGWHQVTTVIDRSVGHAMTIYVDGEPTVSNPDPYGSFNTSAEELRLGWTQEAPYRPFHGALDDVRLYDRALSDAEVKQLYDASREISGTATGLAPFRVRCENRTTGQAVDAGRSRSAWNCEAAGLAVASGDTIAVRLQGTYASNVAGLAAGFVQFGVTCVNRTTGQSVNVRHGHGPWDCGAAGLVASPGDDVAAHVHGLAP